MIKVVAGKYRSRVLEVPPSLTVPTKSVVRLAIGNALSSVIKDANVLDLFAGSGALGIECLSRGARKCDFVDSSLEAIKVIKKNLDLLQEKNGLIHHCDFREFISTCSSSYDIVLLDPPYKSLAFYEESISMILSHSLLNNDGVIMAEYEGNVTFNEEAFSKNKRYNHGRSKFILLWK